MLLGAIIHAGVPVDALASELAKLNVPGVALSAAPSERNGVHGIHVVVKQDASVRKARTVDELVSIIDSSPLAAAVKERSTAVLRRLDQAEAIAHGVEIGQTHLHELGEMDTLYDVAGAVIGLDMLGVEKLYCSPLPTGSGTVKTAHGVLPVPSPATAALFAIAGAPTTPPPGNIPDSGEMVTPTGAAIVTTLAELRQPRMSVERVGYGLGTRNPKGYPNVVAIWLGDKADEAGDAGMSLLDTNLDDISAEVLGYTQERLFALGARDVWFTPIQMKKNRPATMLSALVPSNLEQVAANLILRETTSLGVRVRPITRYEAGREYVRFVSSLGEVGVKIKSIDGAPVSVSAEYEDCRRIALDTGRPLQDVIRVIEAEAWARRLLEGTQPK
ncbi:MAG: nickel pincer cofactor biosynthesis protein LarC [SAR202 cluster bacterium]|nr:nickel pincer cofactor biosynthesis protein LarC [SAR202 cluster bacterium]